MAYPPNMEAFVFVQQATDMATEFLRFAEEKGWDIGATLVALRTAASSIEHTIAVATPNPKEKKG